MPGRTQHLTKLNTVGDTIVEVLIAIAVVSAVLGGAFASSNQSLQGARESQERAEALELLEGQLERLKAATSSDATSGAVFAEAGNFCISNALAPQPGTCNQGTAGRYRIGISRNGASTFTAAANWDKVGGGQDRIRIVYKAHQ